MPAKVGACPTLHCLRCLCAQVSAVIASHSGVARTLVGLRLGTDLLPTSVL